MQAPLEHKPLPHCVLKQQVAAVGSLLEVAGETVSHAPAPLLADEHQSWLVVGHLHLLVMVSQTMSPLHSSTQVASEQQAASLSAEFAGRGARQTLRAAHQAWPALAWARTARQGLRAGKNTASSTGRFFMQHGNPDAPAPQVRVVKPASGLVGRLRMIPLTATACKWQETHVPHCARARSNEAGRRKRPIMHAPAALAVPPQQCTGWLVTGQSGRRWWAQESH